MSIVCVYDRTEVDVVNLLNAISKIKKTGFSSLTEEEQTNWYSGMKGARNYTDINRIESNCETIADMVGITITTKTDWSDADFIKNEDINRILGNISIIREIYSLVYDDTPVVSDPPINTIYKINDIEKILYDKYNIIYNNSINKYYCGESFYSNSDISYGELL